MRPELISFVQQLETRLASFDEDRGEDGWKDATTCINFLERLEHKLVALHGAVHAYEKAREARRVPRQDLGVRQLEVLTVAADIGNYAMMVADVCGALPLAEPNQSDILNLRMRDVLQGARSHIAATGSPTDALHHVVLQEIDDVLNRKSMAMKSVVRVALQMMDENDCDVLLRELGYEQAGGDMPDSHPTEMEGDDADE